MDLRRVATYPHQCASGPCVRPSVVRVAGCTFQLFLYTRCRDIGAGGDAVDPEQWIRTDPSVVRIEGAHITPVRSMSRQTHGMRLQINLERRAGRAGASETSDSMQLTHS